MNLVADGLTASGEVAATPPEFHIHFLQEAPCCHHA
jgi:hypothetical protein